MRPRLIPTLLAAGAVLAAGPLPAFAKVAHAKAPPFVFTDGVSAHAMVAAAEPRAVDAGLAVLRAGGTAADAAVAVQAVLGLVEPQSSGLGGGAFLLYRDAKSGRTQVYDGREVAPAAATDTLFYGENGKPLGFLDGLMSGRSTGVPGAVAMLAKAQADHGKLTWSVLFADAERLADGGFTVGPRMAAALNSNFPQAKAPDAVRYFTKPDGTRFQKGEAMKNPAYAATIRKLAAEGPKALLAGSIAADIVARTHEGAHPGAMTLADLAAYKPMVRDALCRPYRRFTVCAPPPPAGGVGVLEILGLLERTDIAARGPSDPQAWLLFATASRLAYADRDRYVGDPAFTTVPVEGMLAKDYLDARAKLVDAPATLSAAGPPAGSPKGAPFALAADHTAEPGGTTDFAIVDRWGNVASMTTTVESIFGNGRMVDGFFLNNQLTDFSFNPQNTDGSPAANAVAGGKRPRSSMSPVIVLDEKGRFYAALGSPGGNSIVAYVAKALVGLIDWKLPMQQAAALPNLVARGASVSMETGFDPKIVAYLKSKGLPVSADRGEASGIHGVVKRAAHLEGGADPRRDGVARGY